MARNLTREERIRFLMDDNKDKGLLESSEGYCAAYIDGQIAVENLHRNDYHSDKEKSVSTKYTWASSEAKSDKQFLMFIWARLHEVFGEKQDLDYMKRLDALIEKTPGNHRMDITDNKKWDIYRKGKLIWSDPNE